MIGKTQFMVEKISVKLRWQQKLLLSNLNSEEEKI
jgi:hypothetical protein